MDRGAREVPKQGEPAGAPQIPAKTDLPDPHRGHACRGTDDQDRSTGTGTIGAAAAKRPRVGVSGFPEAGFSSGTPEKLAAFID